MATDTFIHISYPRHGDDPFRIKQAITQEINMKVNEGTLDRTVRVIAGAGLMALAATHTVGLWGWIGVVPLITGAVGICPLYSVLGIKTCPMRKL